MANSISGIDFPQAWRRCGLFSGILRIADDLSAGMWFAMGGCELNIPTQSVLNRFISFRIVDVYHPDPDRLLRELHGDDVLQGVVVDISRSAAPECDFAVVQLEGRTEPVIVPTNHVLEVL